MARILIAALLMATALFTAGCASKGTQANSAAVPAQPKFDGVYRLAYAGTGQALYYRFFADGVVLSARSDAPMPDVIDSLELANADTSRGTWRAAGSELRVGVNEGTVWYDSRFDLRPDGRIALRGLPRSFDFIGLDGNGGFATSSR